MLCMQKARTKEVKMRVIAGDARGKRLETLEGEDTRPTIERVKEAMLSSVQFTVAGALVLDLYAGSGQLGIEALSRGAKSCVFLDQNRDAVAMVQKNLKAVGLFEKSRVAQGEATSFLASCKDCFDLVFLDPPYKMDKIPQILPLLEPKISQGGIVLCETEKFAKLPGEVGNLKMAKQYKYGAVMVTKYVKMEME